MPHTRIDGSLIEDGTIDASKMSSTPGDMLKADYDSNDDGIVNEAAACPWTGITGKPSIFASDESIVAVDNVRFENIIPSGNYLSGTLEAIDASMSWQNNSPYTTVSNNDSEDIPIGLLASCVAIKVFYLAVRGTDFEVGEFFLMSDGVSQTEIVDLQQSSPSFSATEGAGLSFSGNINGTGLELRVTSDSSGDDTKFFARWANLKYS